MRTADRWRACPQFPRRHVSVSRRTRRGSGIGPAQRVRIAQHTDLVVISISRHEVPVARGPASQELTRPLVRDDNSTLVLVDTMRRLIASVLAGGVVLMVWSACASGAMTMSEMACCAEHYQGCEMAGMGESCCATDRHADIGMLKPERPDDALATAALDASAATLTAHHTTSLWAWSWVEPIPKSRHVSLVRHLLHDVLLI